MNCPLCGAADQGSSYCTGCGQRIGSGGTIASAPTTMSPKVPESATPPEMPDVSRSAQARQQAADAYLRLEPSEMAVFHAASRIFSAYLAGHKVTDQTEGEYMKKAVSTAIQLAVLTERRVQSDNEEW